jgi:uncharacterized membrane-anchored protein
MFNQEDIMKTGTEFKFQTAPIDPMILLEGNTLRYSLKKEKSRCKTILNGVTVKTVFATHYRQKTGS